VRGGRGKALFGGGKTDEEGLAINGRPTTDLLYEPDKAPLAEKRSVHRRQRGRGRERESLSGDERTPKRTGSRHRERKERRREQESLSGDERTPKRTGNSQRNGP